MLFRATSFCWKLRRTSRLIPRLDSSFWKSTVMTALSLAIMPRGMFLMVWYRSTELRRFLRWVICLSSFCFSICSRSEVFVLGSFYCCEKNLLRFARFSDESCLYCFVNCSISFSELSCCRGECGTVFRGCFWFEASMVWSGLPAPFVTLTVFLFLLSGSCIQPSVSW